MEAAVEEAAEVAAEVKEPEIAAIQTMVTVDTPEDAAEVVVTDTKGRR